MKINWKIFWKSVCGLVFYGHTLQLLITATMIKCLKVGGAYFIGKLTHPLNQNKSKNMWVPR